MRGILVIGVVFVVGLIAGTAAMEANLLDERPSPDDLCNANLEGDEWEADLSASYDISEGTRVVCEAPDGERENITVDVSIDLEVRR